MATDWGYSENSADALTRIADIIDEAAESTADDDSLRTTLVDSAGGSFSPDESPEYPDRRVIGHDLDPNANDDLTVEAGVARSQAILIAANSIDGESWSASTEWLDDSGNIFQTQSATDLDLSAVTDDSSRLFRRGPRIRITFTSEAAAGTQNRLNVFLDTHR